jgi:hypothetical protein
MMSNEPKMILPDSLEGKRLGRIYELSRHIRGSFMDQAIWIDVLITDILAQYFAPDVERRSIFSGDVLGGATLDKKISLLKKIVTRSYADFIKECPDSFPLLEKIKAYRNRLAHALVDTSPEALAEENADCVRFISHKNGVTDSLKVTVAESDKRLGECSKVVFALIKLQSLVAASQPHQQNATP